jgi:hypothetical protein
MANYAAVMTLRPEPAERAVEQIIGNGAALESVLKQADFKFQSSLVEAKAPFS